MKDKTELAFLHVASIGLLKDNVSARIVNLYEGILFLFREFWRPVAYSNSE